MPETLHITPTETVTIVDETADLLAVEAHYTPSGKKPPKHFHPSQDEHFEVLEGTLATRVDGEDRLLRAGDTLDVPRGTVHQMWADGGVARVRWETRPAGRTPQWFRAIDALHRDGRAPGAADWGVLLTEYRDVFRLAVAPDAMTRPALAALAVVGRRRG
jgi:hypothetical protein